MQFQTLDDLDVFQSECAEVDGAGAANDPFARVAECPVSGTGEGGSVEITENRALGFGEFPFAYYIRTGGDLAGDSGQGRAVKTASG